MGQYTAKRRIDYDRTYQAGEPIELDEATAKPLLEADAIEPADPKAKFQDAVLKAEAAARELEEAGGDPSAAHRELQQRRVDGAQAIDEMIDVLVSPGLLAAGLFSPEEAARQIASQVPVARYEDVLARIQARVSELKLQEQEDAAARKAAEESAAREQAKPKTTATNDAGNAAQQAAAPAPGRDAKKRK